MSGFMSNMMENFSGSGGESERFNESQEYDSSDRYGGDYREQERFNETETYDSHGDGGEIPPPPQVSYPWRAHWHDRERRYYFVNEETSETVWDFEEVRRRTGGGGGYYEEQRTDDYDRRGGEYQSYQSEERVEEDRGHRGHHNDYEEDKYRGKDDVRQDEYGGDRFENRGERRYDNAVDDVEYAPERRAGWFGRKEGDGERFDDNVDNSYEEGRYEGRNEYREDY